MSVHLLIRRAFGACAVVAAIVAPASALGAPHHPTGEFARYADCPLSRPTITDCFQSLTRTGSVQLGKRVVPIVNPVLIQGGFEGSGSEISFFGGEDGATLSHTRQPIPGGLSKITPPASWSKLTRELFTELGSGKRVNELWATMELAGPATSIHLNTENMIFEEGVAMAMPVKIHLEGSLLGSACYLGSNARPILMRFSSATSGGLRGGIGELAFNEDYSVAELHGTRLVDGTFAVPAASGCGGALSAAVNPLVDSYLGTPLPAGKSGVVLEGDLWDSPSSLILESETPGP